MRNMAVFDTLLTIQMMDWVPALRVPQTVLVGAPGEVELHEPRSRGAMEGGSIRLGSCSNKECAAPGGF
jgi:hypothetical protein